MVNIDVLKPNIATLFGVLALVTAIILVIDVPQIVNYVFAVFWAGTGVLAFYSAVKR